MSGDVFDVAMRARAVAEQRALLSRSALPVVIRPDALVLSVVGMPGEHAGIWGIAGVRLDQFTAGYSLYSCADPRQKTQQIDLWERFGPVINRYAAWCDQQGVPPQMIVSNRKVLELVEASAEWVLNLDVENDPKAGAARDAVETVLFLVERSGYSGSQCVVPVAETLRDVIVTGSDPTDEPCLGVLLAWLYPSTSPVDEQAESAAGRDRDDCFVPPDDDPAVARVLSRYLNRRRKVSGQDQAALAQSTVAELNELFGQLVTDRFDRVSAAVTALNGLGLSPLPSLAEFGGEDERAWQRHRKRVAARQVSNARWRSVDDPGRAAIKLLTREESAQNWNAAQVWEDPMVRARAEADGVVIAGVASVSPHGTVILSDHPAPRARTGDELFSVDDPKTALRVEHTERVGVGTRIVVSGAFLQGPVLLCPEPPDLGRSVRRVSAAAGRLGRNAPWTHQHPSRADAPQSVGRGSPGGLVERAESIRR